MERIIVINQHLITLTIIQELGVCAKCQQDKPVRLLAQRNDAQKGYCQSCSLNLLEQLTQSNYQFTSKERQSLVENQIIISELRTELTKQLWSDYYSCKKPTCVSCVNLGIKESEYRFCGDNCLVSSYLQYHGQHYLVKNYE